MTELVQRLRTRVERAQSAPRGSYFNDPVMAEIEREAADLIEAQTKRIVALEERVAELEKLVSTFVAAIGKTALKRQHPNMASDAEILREILQGKEP